MFDQLWDRIQNAPAKLSERTSELSNRARYRISRTQGDGQERLWQFSVVALERAETALDSAESIPVISKLTDKGSEIIHGRLDAATGLTINDYDQLTAKQAIRAIQKLDNRLDLARVRRYESNNKGRKTVLGAIERAVTKWNRRFLQPVTV
jgi:hypothetical protein